MTVMKYPGSKNSIAHWIIGHFPAGYENMTYLEPFFGSGCVFFSKEPSLIETINDRDKEIFNLFLQIRENTEELIFLLENTPWSKTDYELSFEKSDNPIEQARRFLVRTWFSIGVNYQNRNSMRMNIDSPTGDYEGFHKRLPEKIRETRERLKHNAKQHVQIDNRDAFQLIQKYNRKNVLMYLDPPYISETRKQKKIYTYEMTNEEHIKLLELITVSKAYVLISGYDNELYNNYLGSWNKDTITTTDTGGNKKTDCLWFNCKIRQTGLFSQGADCAS